MSGFIPAARAFYRSLVMPRVSRDKNAENLQYVLHGEHKDIFKLQKLNEAGGEPMSLMAKLFDVEYYSNFGMGIALYFNTLITLAVISLVSGAILIPSIVEFTKSSYGIETKDPRLSGTAACEDSFFESSMCTDGSTICDFDCDSFTCDLVYRENCDYPGFNVSYPDLAMCAFFAIALILSEMYQNYLQQRVDDAVQTAQDYSLVVRNPPPDASDPDEWEKFFGRFGKVRYVTIVRNNKALMTLLLQKRLLVRDFPGILSVEAYDRKAVAISQIDPSVANYLSWMFGCDRSSEEYQLRQLAKLNIKIHEECQKDHSICSVYVVFEKEDAKTHCVQVLNKENSLVSNFVNGQVHRLRFRSTICLDVKESSEQSNVLWQNAGIGDTERFFRRILSTIVVLGILAGCYILIGHIGHDSLTLLITITIMDNWLPIVMSMVTMLEGAEDEDDRQNSLMIKLFCSRILTSVIFPFVNIPWRFKIDSDSIASIANVQLSSCFVSPMVKLLDPVGTVYRHIFTPLFAKTQADANRYWFGTPFTLAERYTEISKIMFISLFYSALVPSALFIGAIAFLNLFLIDRYILLRKCSPPPKLDNSMGPTVNKQLAFALVCKMLVTIMLVYSWPMDEVYQNSEGNFEEVNKDYEILPLWSFKQKEWQTHAQWRSVVYYITAFYVCVGFCVLVFLFDVFEKIVANLTEPSIQCANQTLYSTVESIVTYCPVLRYGPESFLAADTRYMLSKHRPDTIDLYDADADDGEFNLADYLSRQVVSHHMSQVKWYGGNEETRENEMEETSANETKEARDSANVNAIDIELGVFDSAEVPKKKTSAKKVVPFSSTLEEDKEGLQFVPMVRFSSDERVLLKKLRTELRKNNMRTKFREGSSGVQSGNTKVDYNQFVDAIRSYCPALFPKPPMMYPGVNKDEDAPNENAVSSRKLKLKLRLIFVKVLNMQNARSERKTADEATVDIEVFFRSLVDNEFQLRGD